jgi:phosphatidylglycerophosphatase A
MRRQIGYVLGTWFGCGRVPIAPGTAGTIGAVPLYLLVRGYGPVVVLAVAAVVTAIGVWASYVVIEQTKLKDPQIVVIDEVAGVLVTLAVAPLTWRALVVGVVLFRIFDQFKPWPANVAEKRLPGGWGVMMDDIAAGVWGALVLLVLRRYGVV